MSLQWIADHFFTIQGAIIAIAVLYAIKALVFRDSSSQFKVREADLPRSAQSRTRESPKPESPLLLSGLRLDAEPHEILNVAPDADEATIQKAYKEAMLKYHPDRFSNSNLSPEQVEFYKKAATQLNQAKEKLLKKKS